jgi:hypothetical protein
LELGSGWGIEFTITQTAEKLTVQRPLYARTDMQPPFRLHYALDGSSRGQQVDGGPRHPGTGIHRELGW